MKRGALPILAIDIGTSSVRTALFDALGRRDRESLAQQTYPLHYTTDGGAELLPKWLEQAAERCLRRTLQHRRGAIAAVGVSCFWHSLLGTDAQGRPVTPIYTWADSRCQPDALKLRERFSERVVHGRTGCMLRASYWPAKLRWLRRLGVRAARWMSPGEWLLWRLGGEPRASVSMASGTGLLDITKKDWDEEVLDFCGVKRAQLSPLSDEAFRVAAKKEWADAQWFPAIGDGAAGNLGSGAVHFSVAAINFGTSAAVRVISAKGKAPFGLFRYRVDSDRVLLGGAVSNAGNLRAWCRRELRIRDGMKGQAEGLTVLPFWVSERAPTWPENLRGMVTGLRQTTTANDLLEATANAGFYRLADIAEMLGVNRYVVSGGLTKSPEELQRLTDVLGGEVTVCAEPEASLRGAAVFALEQSGEKVAALPRGRRLRPQRGLTKVHDEARKRQRALEKSEQSRVS